MGMPETIQSAHLSRLAIIYVRQSSPHQTLANRESLKLQYDLQNQAAAAGWPTNQIRVIDTDLGRTGRSAEGRAGFQELVDLVNQGQVGIIFAYDVTRLARNCTEAGANYPGPCQGTPRRAAQVGTSAFSLVHTAHRTIHIN